MRKEYDFSNAIKNPYVRVGKQPVTIRLDTMVLDYFKKVALQVQMPYQTLINSYLAECAKEQRIPTLTWEKTGKTD